MRGPREAMSTTMEATPSKSTGDLQTSEAMRRTWPNRVFALIYAFTIFALLYHHFLNLNVHSNITIISLLMLIADVVVVFMWATIQGFRISPIRRKVFPENLAQVVRDQSEYPALDVFICTADPYKEPPISVVNTALSVMAYDYPMEKLSVYVSDDGGSQLTLFAFMEAAKFASHWLPYCRKNHLVERCPEAYFNSEPPINSPENHNIKMLYESMKIRVENVVKRGTVCCCEDEDELKAFSKWTDDFTRQNHPTVIQVLLDSCIDKDVAGEAMPKLVYVSREKSNATHHHFKAGALNVLLGFRYGTLVEDFYTGYRLQCQGWKSVFCNPKRAAFLGDSPITLLDLLNQTKRWSMGFLDVAFCKYSPITFGARSMNPFQAGCYTHYAFWSIWSIPITIYAFLPQIALINSLPIFPKVSNPWFWLYVFLFMGAYAQDFFEFTSTGGTVQKWWNNQRIWLTRGLSSFPFALFEYVFGCFGLSTSGFNVTSKVVDHEQNKRYNQGIFEFGVSSPMFVPITMAAIINLVAFFSGIIQVLRINGSFEDVFVQMFLAGFVVVNSWPIYEAILLRSDKGKMPVKVTLTSVALAWLLYLGFSSAF